MPFTIGAESRRMTSDIFIIRSSDSTHLLEKSLRKYKGCSETGAY